MAARRDQDLLIDRSLVPTNPFEIQATKEILQRHIDGGDIGQGDVDILKQSYRMVSFASVLGSSLMGAGSYFFLKRRSPHMKIGPRLAIAGGLGMVGSFIGFTMGGVGAAMEVNSKMEDAPRKLKVFAQIATESKRAIQEHRTAEYAGSMSQPSSDYSQFPSGSSSSTSTSTPSIPRRFPSASRPQIDTDTFGRDAEDRREMDQEMDREKSYSTDVGRIEQDSNMSRGPPVRTNEPRRAGMVDQRGGQDRGVWDRIRSGNASGVIGMGEKRTSGGDDMADVPRDERTREQRDFDEMLERERRGVEADETWK